MKVVEREFSSLGTRGQAEKGEHVGLKWSGLSELKEGWRVGLCRHPTAIAGTGGDGGE